MTMNNLVLQILLVAITMHVENYLRFDKEKLFLLLNCAYTSVKTDSLSYRSMNFTRELKDEIKHDEW